jgi:hypothetical protein
LNNFSDGLEKTNPAERRRDYSGNSAFWKARVTSI